jgi:outer membrane protein OmpA-like peptidoglycan-associated protein
MENEKTIKCIKCQVETCVNQGKMTNKGFICEKCFKAYKRKKLIILIIGFIVIIGIVLSCFCYFSISQNKLDGFKGVSNIQDSITIVNVEKPEFSISTVTAKADPINVNQTIDNIESFKRVLTKNIEDAKISNENIIIIPTICLLFDFDSSKINTIGNDLLNEYSKVYLQTNKEATILIQGYTCDYGSDCINNWLSKSRAEQVRNVLVALGIPENSIEVQWFGKSKNNEFSYKETKEYRRVVVSIK